jgi:hypothetical protein
MNTLYNIPVDETVARRAEKQHKQIDIAVNQSRKVRAAVAILEAQYDARFDDQEKEDLPMLSPDVENFLKEMENKFRQE